MKTTISHHPTMVETQFIAAIAIGRNEGVRLISCLRSLQAQKRLSHIVYVDSGSTDESVVVARDMGAQVVRLDSGQPFTAARARNAGLAALREGPPLDFVQFVDGDCILDPNWITAATAFLTDHTDVAAVCGRRREMHPETSAYNRLCDAEWDTPVGETRACGGDALMRWTALDAVGGYDSTLIAGEEPEMCLRMRRMGWKIWRLNAEMTLHDAAMTRFGQFWKRARRGGFAFGEGAAMYGRDAERHGVFGRRRALLWGVALPATILLAALILWPWAMLALLIYPTQVLRLALRDGGSRASWELAWLLMIGKFAEAQGVLEYYWRQRRGGPARLIEYK